MKHMLIGTSAGSKAGGMVQILPLGFALEAGLATEWREPLLGVMSVSI
jgi:hypothetical protein